MLRRHVLVRLVTSAAVLLSASGAALATSGSAPASAVVGITGPDVASYQHRHGVAINWAAVKRQGRDFAIVKATESGWYVNPWFRRDYAGAGKAGLVRGSYHFARPKYPIVKTAKGQAAFYLSHLGDSVHSPGTLPPALDLEVTGGLPRAALIEWAQTFLLTVRKRTGRTPLLYTYPWFWFRTLRDARALRRYPLWFASYDGSRLPGDTRLWQFTAVGKVAGIRGGVDLSRFVATQQEWSTLSDGTAATPWDPAAPGAPIAVHAAAGSHSATVSWLPGDAGTSGITGYHVVASPGGQAVDVGGLTTRATLTGLTNGTAYTFTVTARNAVGVGVPSDPSGSVVPAAPTRLAVSVPRAVPYRAAVRVRARLLQTDVGQPIAGAQVEVSTRPNGHGAWTPLTMLTTDDSGLVTTTVSSPRSLDVRLAYAGAPGVRPAVSARRVLVRTRVGARLSRARTRLHHVVVLSGRIAPAVGGVVIWREGWVGGRWRVWAATRTSSRGTYRFRIVPTVRAVDVYRVVARSAGGRGPGFSKVLRLRAG